MTRYLIPSGYIVAVDVHIIVYYAAFVVSKYGAIKINERRRNGRHLHQVLSGNTKAAGNGHLLGTTIIWWLKMGGITSLVMGLCNFCFVFLTKNVVLCGAPRVSYIMVVTYIYRVQCELYIFYLAKSSFLQDIYSVCLFLCFNAPLWRREGILLCCCLSVGMSVGRSISSFRSFSSYWLHMKWNLVYRFIVRISRSSSNLGTIEPFWTELWPLDFEKLQ
jgi:hypothetical protein